MGLFYSNIFSIVFFCVFEISFQVVMGRMWCTAAGILDGCDMSNVNMEIHSHMFYNYGQKCAPKSLLSNSY